MATQLLIGTRKGAWILRSEDRSDWSLEGPIFLGQIVHHLVLDPRDGRTAMMAAKTGCAAAWKKDPLSGLIGAQEGPLIPMV